MVNLMQTTVGYYAIGTSLADLKDGDIKVHTFEPGEIIKARTKATKELFDVEGDKFQPNLHSIFIGDKEFNVVNRMSKYLGKVDDGSGAPEVLEEESNPKVKGKHPSKKSKVSSASKGDKCG